MRNGDMVTAAFLWEEAELDSDLQFLGQILPRLTFLLESLSRHGLSKDPAELNEEELKKVQRIGAALVYLGEARRAGRQGRG
eukprot:Skav207151  [mRNA]  locus=scaffold573:124318:124592:+ [translate_table: standard]